MAGGFMAGFGSAFSRSFNQASAERAQQEQDMFRLQYADYISKRDNDLELEREDAKVVKAAEILANDYGQPELWGDFYQRLKTGFSEKDIRDHMEEWTPEVTPVTEEALSSDNTPADPRAALSSQAEGSVSAQMAESGTPPPENGGIFGNLRGLFDPMQRQQHKQNKITGMIAEASGTTPEDVLATLRPKEIVTEAEPLSGKKGMQIKWRKKNPYDWAFKATDLEAAKINVIRAIDSGDPKAIQITKKVLEAMTPQLDPGEATRSEAVIRRNEALRKGDRASYDTYDAVIRALDQDQHQEDQRQLSIKLAEEERAEERTLESEDRALERTLGAEDRGELRQIRQESRGEARDIRKEQRERNKPIDYLAENDPVKARNNLIRAELSGNADEAALASKVLGNIALEQELETSRKQRENGIFQSSLGFSDDPMTGKRKVVTKENGQWVDLVSRNPVDDQSKVTPWTEDQEKSMEDFSKDISAPAREYNEKVSAYIQSVRDTQDLIELREQYPRAATMTGQASALANSALRTIYAGFKTITDDAANGVFKPGAISQLDVFENQLDRAIKDFVPTNAADNVRKDGLVYTLMYTKALRATYAQAKAIGAGSGQGLGQKELFVMLDRMMTSDSKAFIQDRRDYIINQHKTLQQEADAFNKNDTRINWLKRKMNLEDLPITPMTNVDQAISDDPEVKAIVDRFMDEGNSIDPNVTNPDQINTGRDGMSPIGKTPGGKIIYQDKSGKKWVDE